MAGVQFRGMMINMTTSILLVTAILISSSATIKAAVADLETATKVQPELAMECWAAMIKVPSCVGDIAKVFMGMGSIFGIGKPCCKAFLSLTEDCKIKVFQQFKFLPVVESFCAAIGGGGGSPQPPCYA